MGDFLDLIQRKETACVADQTTAISPKTAIGPYQLKATLAPLPHP
jgi:hypothetical protein